MTSFADIQRREIQQRRKNTIYTLLLLIAIVVTISSFVFSYA